MGGGHTTSYVMVKQDGSDRYCSEALQHKYSKAPAWSIFGSNLSEGKSSLLNFGKGEWGTTKSFRYNMDILSEMQEFGSG